MKYLILVIFLCRALSAFSADDTTRVLFIGNSFTFRYDIPTLVKNMANEAGFPMKVAMHAISSMSVGDTSKGTQAHMFNPEVYDLIRSDEWDYVSLQDDQGLFMQGYGIFPNPVAYREIEGHIKIRDSVQFYHPCAHMLWYAAWGYKNGYSGISSTGSGLIRNIYNNYQYLRDTAGEIIAPVGLTWIKATDTLPWLDMWDSDEKHQSLAGAYVSAAVFFTTIFHMSPEPVNYTAGLDSTTARTLRRLAYHTVYDSTWATGLGYVVPPMLATAATLTSLPLYIEYKWYRDMAPIVEGSERSISISKSGCYQVLCTDGGYCKSRSWQQCIGEYEAVPVTSMDIRTIRLYPNPATIELKVEAPDGTHADITITNTAGQLVKDIATSTGDAIIPLGELPAGIYFLHLQTTTGSYHAKFVKE